MKKEYKITFLMGFSASAAICLGLLISFHLLSITPFYIGLWIAGKILIIGGIYLYKSWRTST